MGFFNKINQVFGGADSDLLRNGTLALGRILAVTPSGGTIQVAAGFVERGNHRFR